MDVEGKKADSYFELNELREVGTPSINIITLTGYQYTEASFSDIITTLITLLNKSAKIKIQNRYFLKADFCMDYSCKKSAFFVFIKK
ncbi:MULTISPECIES: hypothetical protein [Paenibacillus]|uniref:Uncharacterized protein n=3 Tax=Paenibacillus barengoltzii TaxID=343517 RepID=R9LC07_9BACL|nr:MULTISPECIES: hypothetical protein [Paenibacillus]EOS56123.1 hypothetical protein C812_02185 [Paenibacillus barengoltzii G22]SME99470.1 hypothetical protein SAMN02744124_00719 [Paenibacillus barengoltzii J12]